MQAIRRGLLALALGVMAAGTHAQSFPTKAIRVFVPFPAGGGTDVIARDITHKLTTHKGWTFVIENRPGSGGNIGLDAALRSPADGYTIALGQTSNLAVNPTLYTKMPYDVATDVTPIAMVASAPLVFVVAADSPYNTLAELLEAAKAKPSELNFASPGNGTVTHLTGELLQKAAGVHFTHVPYKGAAQAVTDLIGGQVQIYAATVPTLLSHIKNKKVKPLVVTSAERVEDLAHVPTVAESGFRDFDASSWFGFIGPANLPQDVVALLNREINLALKSPELKKRLNEQGATTLSGTPDEFAALIKADTARWAPIIKESGAKLD